MGGIKRALQEIRDKGWPATNKSLKKLIKEKARNKRKLRLKK
tara:strand:- start:684 stop:809 length:126 start_codon:yes stop_codon:yes gene_type:complete